MFEMIGEVEKMIVINCMEEIIAEPKQVVIKEGDEGDCLYVVGSGTLQCTKRFEGSSAPTFLKTYQPGEVFGELALLYNTPRAATITANEDCQLWRLNRDCFNHVVKDAANAKREKYDQFIRSINIFSTMDPYERARITDAFKEKFYPANEYIITEGQIGDELFFVVEGVAIATKVLASTGLCE